MKNVFENISDLLSPILNAENAVLVDIEIKRTTGNKIIKIFVESEGGISLDKCERINRKLSDQLDMVDIIHGKYRLEVSSPGVDRPLRHIQDYHRNINREVNLIYENSMGDHKFKGKIIDISEDIIQLQGVKETKEIHFSKIKESKISLPW